MEASRNNRGEAHENGAVESQNRHLKAAIAQALILRGNRDFASLADYRRFVDLLVARRNRQRADAVLAERGHLERVRQKRIPVLSDTRKNRRSAPVGPPHHRTGGSPPAKPTSPRPLFRILRKIGAPGPVVSWSRASFTARRHS